MSGPARTWTACCLYPCEETTVEGSPWCKRHLDMLPSNLRGLTTGIGQAEDTQDHFESGVANGVLYFSLLSQLERVKCTQCEGFVEHLQALGEQQWYKLAIYHVEAHHDIARQGQDITDWVVWRMRQRGWPQDKQRQVLDILVAQEAH